jgi:hypothetical protein
MISRDDTFPADYEAQILDEARNAEPTHQFRRSDSQGTSPMFVEVVPNDGAPWVAFVEKPRPTVKSTLSGIYATPNPARALILASGDAYLVDVHDPDKYEPVDTAGPVVALLPAVSDGLLLLASPWTVTAIGPEGVAWQTGRLAIDGLRLDEIGEGRIAGVADPDSDDESRDFAIDLRTGAHEGGTPFT